MSATARIPVVFYHSVGHRNRHWKWADLTCPVGLFAEQLDLLRGRGYRCLSLDDLHDHQAGRLSPPARGVVLTFDDGFLDNWTHVVPLLDRAGWTATVYVNPDFVDPGEEPRPTLADVWSGKLAESDLPRFGFLNWAELRAIQASGVMTIGCHSQTHTWYPRGPEIEDYHRPGLDTPWLAWNAAPERKHRYLTEDQSDLVPLGTPIHVHGRSLGIRRYLPDPEQLRAVATYVADHGAQSFFDDPDWRSRLDRLVAELGPGSARFETDEEMSQRFHAEIAGARATLSRALGAEPSHFAWPGGTYIDESWAVAEAAGFRTLCIPSEMPRWASDDPRFVRRLPCQDGFYLRGRRYVVSDPHLLYLACETFRGASWKRWSMRWRKLLHAASGRHARVEG